MAAQQPDQRTGVARSEEGPARPLAVGYVAVRSATSAVQEVELRQELLAYAASHGYRLCGIFTEREGEPGLRALASLVEALQKSDVRIVIIPGSDHL